MALLPHLIILFCFISIPLAQLNLTLAFLIYNLLYPSSHLSLAVSAMMSFLFHVTDITCIIEGFRERTTFVSTNTIAYRVVVAEVTDFSGKEALQSRCSPLQCKSSTNLVTFSKYY